MKKLELVKKVAVIGTSRPTVHKYILTLNSLAAPHKDSRLAQQHTSTVCLLKMFYRKMNLEKKLLNGVVTTHTLTSFDPLTSVLEK